MSLGYKMWRREKKLITGVSSIYDVDLTKT